MTLSRPPKTETGIRRVAILFAGGPAPAANAVIGAAATSFLEDGREKETREKFDPGEP